MTNGSIIDFMRGVWVVGAPGPRCVWGGVGLYACELSDSPWLVTMHCRLLPTVNSGARAAGGGWVARPVAAAEAGCWDNTPGRGSSGAAAASLMVGVGVVVVVVVLLLPLVRAYTYALWHMDPYATFCGWKVDVMWMEWLGLGLGFGLGFRVRVRVCVVVVCCGGVLWWCVLGCVVVVCVGVCVVVCWG